MLALCCLTIDLRPGEYQNTNSYLNPAEQADNDLGKIKKFYARQIVSRIETVLLHRAEDVSRSSVKKLRGFETFYRLRVGDYRIFYQVQSNEVTILRVLSKDEEAEFYEEAKRYENNSNI